MGVTSKILGVLLIGGALYAYHQWPNEVEQTAKHVGKEAGTLIAQATDVAEQVIQQTKYNKGEKEPTEEAQGNPNRAARKQRQLELPERMKGTPERIIKHTGYTLSFNREHNSPNWVAWELTAEETEGTKQRADDFLPDPEVPAPHRVTTDDYKNSGYDRGHMIPAADMKWSAQAMKECFYMSNMCPQNGSLNSGPWSTLEKACRRWAKQEGNIYIICGPVYKTQRPKTIGRDFRISVPDGFFKAVLSVREGHEKAIAFYYANRAGKQPMSATACSVDEIEELTGINCFVALPDEVENKVEASYSLKAWK